VTGDLVAGVRDLPDQGWKPLGYPAEDEEGPLNVLSLKQLQDRMDLMLESRRKKSPLRVAQRLLNFSCVEVFLYIDRYGINHKSLIARSSPASFQAKDSRRVEYRNSPQHSGIEYALKHVVLKNTSCSTLGANLITCWNTSC
jgi:hypothetical protein